MADEAELRREVLARPLDDAPRHAFAAAADARGDGRGELVRVQLALHQAEHGEPRAPAARRVELRARSEALLAAHDRDWAGRVATIAEAWTWKRGFIERVTVDAATFLAQGDRLFAEEPIIHVRLVGTRRIDLRALFASPLLERLLALDLSGEQLGDDGVGVLARSARLHELRWLSLYDNNVDRLGAALLAASDRLPNLRYVAFGKNWVDPVARPAGVDPDGAILGTELPDEGRELADRFGLKPWLRCDARNIERWPPDLYDVL